MILFVLFLLAIVPPPFYKKERQIDHIIFSLVHIVWDLVCINPHELFLFFTTKRTFDSILQNPSCNSDILYTML
jgi:hypothetical protein